MPKILCIASAGQTHTERSDFSPTGMTRSFSISNGLISRCFRSRSRFRLIVDLFRCFALSVQKILESTQQGEIQALPSKSLPTSLVIVIDKQKRRRWFLAFACWLNPDYARVANKRCATNRTYYSKQRSLQCSIRCQVWNWCWAKFLLHKCIVSIDKDV